MNYHAKMLVAAALRPLGFPACWFSHPDSDPSEWMTNEETHERRTEADGSVTRRVTQTWERRDGTEYTKSLTVNRADEYHEYREVKW